MYTDQQVDAIQARLRDLRRDAAAHRLLTAAQPRPERVNVWTWLLPRLRRLEDWMERRAGMVRS